MNVTVRLVCKLAYCDVAILYISNYVTETPPSEISKFIYLSSNISSTKTEVNILW